MKYEFNEKLKVEHIVAVISKTRNKAKVCMQCDYYEKDKTVEHIVAAITKTRNRAMFW